MVDLQSRRNAVGIFRIVFRSAVAEGDPLHQAARQRVMQTGVVVVVGHEHQFAPTGAALLQRFAQHRGHDIHQRMVGTLARLRVALRRIGDDVKCRLIDDNLEAARFALPTFQNRRIG